MFTQMNSSLPNLVPRVPYYTRWHGFRNEGAEYESVPYSEHQEEAPDSSPDGRAQQAEPDGLEVEDLRRVLVRIDLPQITNWEIRLIYIMALLAISRIFRWTGSFIFEYQKYNVRNQELLPS